MRFRRKRDNEAAESAETPETAPQAPQVEGPRAHGPFDFSEMPVDEEDPTRANLGSMFVQATEDVEIRLQADENTEQVQAVMLVSADGAMELRAFAAPRHEDLWADIRRQMGAEATRRGGTATELDGPYGPALHVVVTGQTPDGQTVQQPSTVLGISGPRWLLRVSMFGRPAKEFRPDAPLETALRQVVIRRGDAAMAPGEPLPLTLPDTAERMDLPSEDG